MEEENKEIKIGFLKDEDIFKILSLEEQSRIRIVKKIFQMIEQQLDESIKNKTVPSKDILDTICNFKDLIIKN